MRQPAVLQIQDLNVHIGGRELLRGCSVDVGRGEVAAIVGPNGAGKTVMLRAAAGFVSLRSGRVLLDGRDISRLHPENRARTGLCLVPQERRIFAGLTVEQNLQLGAFPLRRNRRGYQDVLEEVLELFPVFVDRLDQPAGTLSRGEQTLLALARSLMSAPKAMLVDEPFGGLSDDAMADLADTLRILGGRGKAILFTEQDHTRAMRAADRCLVMRTGRIEAAKVNDDAS